MRSNVFLKHLDVVGEETLVKELLHETLLIADLNDILIDSNLVDEAYGQFEKSN